MNLEADEPRIGLVGLKSATMYGPAVRSKMEFRKGERESCINVFDL